MYREALVKFKDREDEAFSWERVSTLTKNFWSSFLRTKTLLKASRARGRKS